MVATPGGLLYDAASDMIFSKLLLLKVLLAAGAGMVIMALL
jgi:hypothetical protein